ncbi:MAG: virulence-associated protein E, partial [Oscillospiraceae bacterium]|nr:virulence-associated protein E [Oscillospiraceae bacterium]
MRTINNDRLIKISSAGTRKAVIWPVSEILWSEFIKKIEIPVRSSESLDEYMKMKKAKQDDLKDVGGFVGGTFEGNRRKANLVTGRDIITLDLDNIQAGGTGDILRRIEGLGCGYCVYSTRKHCEAKPRLRVIIPLDRSVTADEYEPCARKLASIIGIEYCDPTT